MDRRLSLKDAPLGILVTLATFVGAVAALGLLALMALLTFDLVVMASSADFGAGHAIALAFFLLWFLVAIVVALGPLSGRPKKVSLLLLLISPPVGAAVGIGMLGARVTVRRSNPGPPPAYP